MLGLVSLLADADQERFARGLALCGLLDIECRRLDLSRAPRLMLASKYIPFASSLAAGDIDTARAIAKLSPAAHQAGFEYEEDFFRYHFLHHFVLDPDDISGGEVLLSRWEVAAEGDPSPHHALSQALLRGDAAMFEDAMADVIARRKENLEKWRKTPAYRLEEDATAGSTGDNSLIARDRPLDGTPCWDELVRRSLIQRARQHWPAPSQFSWDAKRQAGRHPLLHEVR